MNDATPAAPAWWARLECGSCAGGPPIISTGENGLPRAEIRHDADCPVHNGTVRGDHDILRAFNPGIDELAEAAWQRQQEAGDA